MIVTAKATGNKITAKIVPIIAKMACVSDPRVFPTLWKYKQATGHKSESTIMIGSVIPNASIHCTITRSQKGIPLHSDSESGSKARLAHGNSVKKLLHFRLRTGRK